MTIVNPARGLRVGPEHAGRTALGRVRWAAAHDVPAVAYDQKQCYDVSQSQTFLCFGTLAKTQLESQNIGMAGLKYTAGVLETIHTVEDQVVSIQASVLNKFSTIWIQL